MNKLLLSCDWGTSSFRLRLVDLDTHTIINEVFSNDGISATHRAWEKSGEPAAGNKPEFYIRKLLQEIRRLSDHLYLDIKYTPLIISGMASSTLGLSALPYAQLPFDVGGNELVIELREFSELFPHDIYLVSGIRSKSDVMRGEETQLIGVFELLKRQNKEMDRNSVLIFPGTHSKHIFIKDGKIINFNTYLTGELFALIGGKSILREAVALPDENHKPDEQDLMAFRKGVRISQSSNFSKILFTVRTNWLFGIFDKYRNYFYLSGLVIGAELKDLKMMQRGELILCSGSHVYDLYKVAFEELMLRVQVIPAAIIDQAAIEGHIKIFQNINFETRYKAI